VALAAILGALAPAAALPTPPTPGGGSPRAHLAVGVSRPHSPFPAPHASTSIHRRRRHPHRRPAPLSVSVKGRQLVNAQGHALRLVGVNRSGGQYMCVLGRGIFDGPADAASIAAMKAWKINAVRVPLNEDCWLGINGLDQAYSGVAYRAAVESYVARLNAAGLYVILEVHWNAPGGEQAGGQQQMLDASHGYALWRSIATLFKSNPAVLFDLYNEPHDLGGSTAEQWTCWAQGCGKFTGMDGLLATVRATGARNVVLVAGLGWAADDSGWLAHEPHDPLHQLAATFHVYRAHSLCTAESCWNGTLLPIAAQVPLVADEFGEMQCGDPASIAWLNRWMAYATANGLSMLAWSWNANAGDCSPGPLLIASYAGAPTPYGAAIKAFFAEHVQR
jgi:hypothetical protein